MSLSLGLGERPVLLMPPTPWTGQPHRSHSHTVQFYETDAALLDELESYIGTALVFGDAAVVIATEEHRIGLAERLRARGLEVAHALGQGRYIALDAAETLAMCVPDGRPDRARFFDLVGNVLKRARAAALGEDPRVAAFGELVALLSAQGNHEAAIELEELWNELAMTHPFSLHCGYPVHYFVGEASGDPLRRICETHSGVIPCESYTALPDDDLRLRAVALLQQKAQALAAEVEERKQAERALRIQEEALRERNRELSAALAARDEFLSVAAHELKTPITSLRLFAQLLLNDARCGQAVAPERIERALHAIDLQTDKLNRLLARLLDTAQIETGRLRLDRLPTDLVALVRAVGERQVVGPVHTLIFDAPAHLAAVVDPVRFEQVVANLLDNAVKFSPNGGTVEVALGRDGDGSIRLSVTDHGVGIPPDQREAVFDRLHHAHGEPHLSGMGLGLYVTREIIQSHGGSVRIEDPGHPGCRFVVVLPPTSVGAQIEAVA
jgi:signal transduction histidine kinase